jgi:hypothetical protein
VHPFVSKQTKCGIVHKIFGTNGMTKHLHLLQDFNDEQTRLMSSMQGGGTRRLEGVDNPSLDIGSNNGHIHHPHNSTLGYNNPPPQGAKMSGGYNYSDSSSTAQSLSLSSSNTDSCDTVIYKG